MGWRLREQTATVPFVNEVTVRVAGKTCIHPLKHVWLQLVAALLLTVVAPPGDARSGILRSKFPTGVSLEHVPGVAYSTHQDLPIPNCSWRYWYLQHSKKVWFQIDRRAVAGLRPVFSHEGKLILHRSEVATARNLAHTTGRGPVVWGDFPSWGWGQGPGGTQLYLELWTRWTWLHPEACGHPQTFGVVFFGPEKRSPGSN
ncbi:hypothetical protein H6G65_17210 [Microcystis elabens FACHB-917]|nr:hypothetical protein [Microcystis elabens FACHB-917]